MGKPRGDWLPTAFLAFCVALSLLWLVNIFLAGMRRHPEPTYRIRCRNNLNYLAKGMATYLNELGDNRFYPFPLGRGIRTCDFNGAEWLASLYWARIEPDPGGFLCPESGDTNNEGADLGVDRAPRSRFGPQTVSYAAVHYYSLTDKAGKPIPGAIPAEYPGSKVMACDDTDGTINHGANKNPGMNVLFFDSHVEYWTNTRVDLETGLGAGDLCALRN